MIYYFCNKGVPALVNSEHCSFPSKCKGFNLSRLNPDTQMCDSDIIGGKTHLAVMGKRYTFYYHDCNPNCVWDGPSNLLNTDLVDDLGYSDLWELWKNIVRVKTAMANITQP